MMVGRERGGGRRGVSVQGRCEVCARGERANGVRAGGGKALIVCWAWWEGSVEDGCAKGECATGVNRWGRKGESEGGVQRGV